MKNPIDRFMSNVMPEPNSGCWLWDGSLRRNGYGVFSFGKISFGAHRVSYDLFCEPIPEGMQVLHKCDVKCCVNPDHLFTGTQKDNMRDMLSKGRANKARGAKNASAKLSEIDVLNIRRTARTYTSIAQLYGVSVQVISKIKNRKSWKHI